MRFLILGILFLFAGFARCAEITVCTAMGMKEPITRAGELFSRNGNRVFFNFSSSGKLARQIEAGIPADVYISASKFWMDYLLEKKLVEHVRPLARTKLVFVTRVDSPFKTPESAKRIAVGDRFAPVGKYAVQALKSLGLYEKLKGRFVFAPDVRQIAVWVITGNADAGIIYYSDFLKFKDKLRILKEIPEDAHDPIEFYIGVISYSKNKEVAKSFVDFVTSLKRDFFEEFGFEKGEEGCSIPRRSSR